MQKKKRKIKINYKKLFSCIFMLLITIYFLACSISYSIKITNKAKQYQPKEKIIIVK